MEYEQQLYHFEQKQNIYKEQVKLMVLKLEAAEFVIRQNKKQEAGSGKVDVGAALSRVEIRIGKHLSEAFEVFLINLREVGQEECS